MDGCFAGKAGEFIDRGDNTYGGRYVINPSGGLISKGHPLGATGTLCYMLLTLPLKMLHLSYRSDKLKVISTVNVFKCFAVAWSCAGS